MRDVAIVGARCAGSPLAAWLARAGLRVLVLDRATFPSPTLSTHTMHADSLAVLDDLGLGAALAALGAPAVTHAVCDYGDFRIAGRLPPYRGIARGYCVPRAPRRSAPRSRRRCSSRTSSPGPAGSAACAPAAAPARS